MKKNLVQSKLFFQHKKFGENDRANSEESYQWLWQSRKQVVGKNVILNLRKHRGTVQKEAVELWTAKSKNDQDKNWITMFSSS